MLQKIIRLGRFSIRSFPSALPPLISVRSLLKRTNIPKTLMRVKDMSMQNALWRSRRLAGIMYYVINSFEANLF